jgi:CBS domain-containing protein
MENLFPRQVRDAMTRKIAVLREEQNLELAEMAMKTYHFRHLPVVEGDKLIGLVTERDLLRAAVSSLNEAHDLLDDNLKRYYFVREIMTTEVVSVRPESLLADAARLLTKNKIDCLPVTQEDGTLVGILTASDLIELTIGFLDANETTLRETGRSATT